MESLLVALGGISIVAGLGAWIWTRRTSLGPRSRSGTADDATSAYLLTHHAHHHGGQTSSVHCDGGSVGGVDAGCGDAGGV